MREGAARARAWGRASLVFLLPPSPSITTEKKRKRTAPHARPHELRTMNASTRPSGASPSADPASGSGTRVHPTTLTRWFVVALGLYSATAFVPRCESRRRVASMPQEMGPRAYISAFIASRPDRRPCSATVRRR